MSNVLTTDTKDMVEEFGAKLCGLNGKNYLLVEALILETAGKLLAAHRANCPNHPVFRRLTLEETVEGLAFIIAAAVIKPVLEREYAAQRRRRAKAKAKASAARPPRSRRKMCGKGE